MAKKSIEQTYNKINKQIENHYVSSDFLKTRHQTAIFESLHGKKGLIKKYMSKGLSEDEAFKKAAIYARTEEGATFLSNQIQERVIGEAQKKLNNLPVWQRSNYLPGFLLNTDSLKDLFGKTGIATSYNEFYEQKVIPQALQSIQRIQTILMANSIKNSQIKDLINRIGLKAVDNNYDSVAQNVSKNY